MSFKGLSKLVGKSKDKQRLERLAKAVNDQRRPDQCLEFAQSGQVNLLESVLENPMGNKKRAEICNYQDSHGRAALHFAASKNFADCVELLIVHGANIDLQDSRGNSALHLAALSNHWDTVRLLLESGANPSLRDSTSRTPLDLVRSRIRILSQRHESSNHLLIELKKVYLIMILFFNVVQDD